MMYVLSTLCIISAYLQLTTKAESHLLFGYEQEQLTRSYVASLPEEDAQLFAFEDQIFDIEAVNTTDQRCRYDPTHKKFPAEKAWNKLRNKLSSAKALISAVPQAAVCYGTSKSDAQCSQLTGSWNTNTITNDPIEIHSPIYQGLTCQPPSIYDSGACTLGGYPSYVVNAATVSDIQSAVNFARNEYLRLVVKNTGLDFVGRSTGYGALSIWTHGMKDMIFFDSYVDGNGYSGPAIKAGAGVQVSDLYKFASNHGVIAVANADSNVGFSGGYIQGGGYSPLSSLYGLAADHVLGFEIVTAVGEFVTANSTSNQDLFWALKGGGGGTFGVISSVIIKVYPEIPVAAAAWSLDSSKIGRDKFWTATKAFFDRALENVDSGTYSQVALKPRGNDFIFTVKPYFAANKTTKQLNSLLAPYFSKLTSSNIPISSEITEYKTFYAAWQNQFPQDSQPNVSNVFGSRLFPRSNFASETGRNVTFNVLRQTLEAGQSILAFNMATRGSNPDNAVSPALRESVYHIVVSKSINHKDSVINIMTARAGLTNGTLAKWRDITPNSGTYLNEADRMEINWQQSFWGSKYAKLLDIKKELDHRELFWAHHAVGSEGWQVESFDGLPNENGKLCKV